MSHDKRTSCPRGTEEARGRRIPHTPRQASLAGLATLGRSPRRSLGQNFLVDDNIVRVILANLDCRSDDVALEVGAGFGVLTRALVGVARHVHVFEIDPQLASSLRCALREESVPAERLSLYEADVLRAPLHKLAPAPTVCASNLPYSIAAPFLAQAVSDLPHVRRYVVMVQKEIADRLVAGTGTKTYGALSVWMRLHTTAGEVRSVSRSVFRPVPRVDSALLTLNRRPADPFVTGEPALLRAVIGGAFSQRRKTWVNALAAAWGRSKEEVAEAGAAAGLAAGRRAEQLEPVERLALAREVAARGWRPPAPAGGRHPTRRSAREAE